MPGADRRKAAKARAPASLALISDAEEAAINRGIEGDPEAMEMTIDVLKQANPELRAPSHDAFALPLL